MDSKASAAIGTVVGVAVTAVTAIVVAKLRESQVSQAHTLEQAQLAHEAYNNGWNDGVRETQAANRYAALSEL